MSNINFKGLYNMQQNDAKTVRISDKWGYKALEQTLGKKISLPHSLEPFAENVSQMQKSIVDTNDLVQQKSQLADKYKKDVLSLYKDAKEGKKPGNLLFSIRNIKQNEYATLAELNNNGSIKRISHIKNGKVAVIYNLFSDVNASAFNILNDYNNPISAEGYFYSDDKCIEYVDGICHSLKNYAFNFDFLLPDKQWPSRNMDNTPVKQVIGFKNNGSYEAYSHYLYGLPKEFKKAVSLVAGKDGKVDVKCTLDNGLTYSYTNEYKHIGYPQHSLKTGQSTHSKMYVW